MIKKYFLNCYLSEWIGDMACSVRLHFDVFGNVYVYIDSSIVLEINKADSKVLLKYLRRKKEFELLNSKCSK